MGLMEMVSELDRLDRLDRLKEALREEDPSEQMSIILEWCESCGKPDTVSDGDDGTAK